MLYFIVRNCVFLTGVLSHVTPLHDKAENFLLTFCPLSPCLPAPTESRAGRYWEEEEEGKFQTR
jgi:hypothetical protein